MAKRHPPANVVNVHSRHDTRAVKYALISMMDSDMYHTKHILPNKQNIGWSKLYIIRLINIARSYVKRGMRVINTTTIVQNGVTWLLIFFIPIPTNQLSELM